jgi:hypothetical protein
MTMKSVVNRLFLPVPNEQKTLTVKLDLDTLAEFAVAVRLLRGRSISSHVHQFVISQINEARRLVSPEQFRQLVEDQKEATSSRAESRALAAANGKNKKRGPLKAGHVVLTDQKERRKTGTDG